MILIEVIEFKEYGGNIETAYITGPCSWLFIKSDDKHPAFGTARAERIIKHIESLLDKGADMSVQVNKTKVKSEEELEILFTFLREGKRW